MLKSNKEKFFLFDKKNQRVQNLQEKNQTSNSKPQLSTKDKKSNKTTKKTQDTKLVFLEKFTQEKSGLEIHNKALNLLNLNQQEEAFLLLKKNLYQNFFFPSYFVLSHFEIPVFFTPFLWHISLIFLAFVCLFFLFLSFKQPNSFHFKLLLLCLSLSFTVLFSGIFLLKKRVSSSQEVILRSAPFVEASINTSLKPNSNLIVLTQTKDWLRVQSPDKQTGWLQKEKVFQIF